MGKNHRGKRFGLVSLMTILSISACQVTRRGAAPKDLVGRLCKIDDYLVTATCSTMEPVAQGKFSLVKGRGHFTLKNDLLIDPPTDTPRDGQIGCRYVSSDWKLEYKVPANEAAELSTVFAVDKAGLQSLITNLNMLFYPKNIVGMAREPELVTAHEYKANEDLRGWKLDLGFGEIMQAASNKSVVNFDLPRQSLVVNMAEGSKRESLTLATGCQIELKRDR